MAGVVDGFRWAILGSGSSSGAMLGISIAAVLAILFGGLVWFRRMERSFADLV
jgi:lipopolysaccharide transport system permease protein